jgi:hypothetical protein
MDALDTVAPAGRDLMRRVDAALTAHGAPADHGIWTLVRRLGALPGDVLAAFVDLRPAPLHASGAEIRRAADARVEERADLAAAVGAVHWEGAAADAFAARWEALDRHLGDRASPADHSMAGRLAAMAVYLEEVAGWVRDARLDLARTVADALGSTEAVRLRGGGSDPTALAAGLDAAAVSAAATVGAAVLTVADRQVAAAETIADRWRGALADLPFPAAGSGATGTDPTVAGSTGVAL